MSGGGDDIDQQVREVLDDVGLTETDIVTINKFVARAECTPATFINLLKHKGWVKIDAAGVHPLRMLSAEQAHRIVHERRLHEMNTNHMWVWEHAVFFLCANYWSIEPQTKVAYCYYSDWGQRPHVADGKLKLALLSRAERRSRFALSQLHHYPTLSEAVRSALSVS